MPVYEYACSKCGHEFEAEQRITEPPLKTCPRCRARKLKRLISQTSFVLKGSGWYADLYSSKAKPESADAKPEAAACEVRGGRRERAAERRAARAARPPATPSRRRSARASPARARARRPPPSKRAEPARSEAKPSGVHSGPPALSCRAEHEPAPPPHDRRRRSRLANELRDALAERGRRACAPPAGAPPCLAVVLVGDDPASASYIKGKRRACERVGMTSVEHALSAASERGRGDRAGPELNDDPGVDGILVQLPLPKGMRPNRVATAIDPAKDVDGLHPSTRGGCCSASLAWFPAPRSGS